MISIICHVWNAFRAILTVMSKKKWWKNITCDTHVKIIILIDLYRNWTMNWSFKNFWCAKNRIFSPALHFIIVIIAEVNFIYWLTRFFSWLATKTNFDHFTAKSLKRYKVNNKTWLIPCDFHATFIVAKSNHPWSQWLDRSWQVQSTTQSNCWISSQ